MNQEQLLDQLIDPSAPEIISWWPLAPGWWFLIILSVICSAVLITFLLKRHRNLLWKRQAIKEFKALSYKALNNRKLLENKSMHREYIELIKRILAAKTRNTHILALTGEDFLDIMNEHDKKQLILSDMKELQLSIYSSTTKPMNHEIFSKTRKWLAGL